MKWLFFGMFFFAKVTAFEHDEQSPILELPMAVTVNDRTEFENELHLQAVLFLKKHKVREGSFHLWVNEINPLKRGYCRFLYGVKVKRIEKNKIRTAFRIKNILKRKLPNGQYEPVLIPFLEQ